jgi:hypothetical protein
VHVPPPSGGNRTSWLLTCGGALALLVGYIWLPLISVGAVERSMVGAVRSGVRSGLVGGPLVVLLVAAGAVSLVSPVLAAGKTRRGRLVAFVAVALAVLWCVGGVAVSGSLNPGSLVLALGSVAVAAGSARQSPATAPRVAMLATIGALGLSIWMLAGLRGGTAGPKQAVGEFTQALASGDNLAVLELLDPYERTPLVDDGRQVVQELRRLGVLSRTSITGQSAAAPAAVLGAVSPLADGLTSVAIDGTVRIPTLIERTIGSEPAKRVQQPSQLTTVRRSGRWFVSVLHTAAEERRLALGRELPTGPIEPVGAPNPEAAVRQLLSAIATIDLDAAVATMDPHEASVLSSYARVQQPEVDRLRAWSQDNATWTFPDVGLSSTTNGDRATVRVTRLSAQLDLPSDLGIGSSAVLDGDCARVTIERESSRHCGEEIPQVIADLFAATAPDLGDLSWLSEPDQLAQIVVVKRDGRWFVAPISSAFATASDRLRTYEPDDLQGEGNDLPSRLRRAADSPLFELIRG